MLTAILKVLLVLVGLEHFGIAWLEMRATPEKQAALFAMPLTFVRQPQAQTALANQGIYNLMLGVSMLATLAVATTAFAQVALILFGFLLVVGLYGGVTVTKSIYLFQVLPAVVGLALAAGILLG